MSELHVVKARGKKKILKPISRKEIQNNIIEGKDGTVIDSQHLLISMLLPPAVQAFMAELEKEVNTLCGARHSQGGDASRWGAQSGSILLGNQRIAIEKPRVRSAGQEVPLSTYARFQDPGILSEYSESLIIS
jgi:hypothetical protein